MADYHEKEGWVLRRVADIVSLVGGGLILVFAAIIVFDIFMRNYGRPLVIVNEIDTITLAVVVTAFIVVGVIGHHFVSITFLSNALVNRDPPKTKWAAAVKTLTAFSTFIFFVPFAWQIWQRIELDLELSGTTSYLEIPTGPWWYTSGVLFLICVPLALVVAIRRYRQFFLGYAPDPDKVDTSKAT